MTRATEDLNDVAAYPFADGADEIVLRVSRYEPDGKTPACYQCIVRGSNRNRLWGLGISANPVAALSRAMQTFYDPKHGVSNSTLAWRDTVIRSGGHVPDEIEPEKAEPCVEDLLA